MSAVADGEGAHPVQIELTPEARELATRKGGTVLVDYIGPTG